MFRFGKRDIAGLSESSPATVVKGSQLSNLLGDKNVTNVMVNGKACLAIIDSGSEVSTIARSYVPDNDIQELDTQLTVHAAGGHVVTYLGVSEIDVQINPSIGDDCDKLTVLALVVPDSNIDSTVPLILGTRVIRQYYENHMQNKSNQVVPLPKAWQMAFLAMQMIDDHDGIVGVVKCTKSECIPPNSRKVVHGLCRLSRRSPLNSRLAMTEAIPEHALPGGLLVSPNLVKTIDNPNVSTGWILVLIVMSLAILRMYL